MCICKVHTTSSGCDSFCPFENFCGERRIDALCFSIIKSKEKKFSLTDKLDALFGFKRDLSSKVCSRANGFEKLLLGNAVCML